MKAWVRILRAELEVATKRSMLCARDALDWYRTHIAIPSPRTTKTLVRMKSRAVSYPVADNCCGNSEPSFSSSAVSYEKTEGGGVAILCEVGAAWC